MTRKPLAALVRAVVLSCPLAFAFAAPGSSVWDDLDHASFEGMVRDANGGAIAQTRILLRRMGLDLERATRSDEDGRYRFPAVPPGLYELRAEAKGFQSVRYEKITAAAGASVKTDFRLSPAAIQAELTIDAESNDALVDTARTVVGGSVARREIDSLPVESRNPFDLIFTLARTSSPGLSDRDLAEGDRQSSYRRPPEETGVFSLAGGAPFSNNLTIEGLDNNDDRAARERFLPSMHAVEEVQVVTNQFSAEYGRASGGRVNLRLRGGANEVHGQAFHYFRDESFNANPFLRNADPARAKRLPYQNHNPGFGLGAPLKKDRVFLFSAYEFDYIHDRAEIAALVPIAGNPAFALPKPNGANLGFEAKDKNGKTVVVNDGVAVGLYDEKLATPRIAHTLQSRADFKLGEKHDSFALFTLASNRDERGFPGGRRTLDTLRRAGRNSRSLAFADNFILSKRMVSIARFQFSRLSPADAPPGKSPVVIVDFDDPRDVIGNPDANPLTRHGRLTAGASTIGGVDRREDRYQAQETLNYVRGAHALRFGVDVQAIRSRFIDLNDSTGTFTFASAGDFLAGKPSRYEHRFFTDSELRNTYTGLFFQDDWKPRRNLTVAFGLRWDNETILADRNNLGPRVSVAWSPRSSAKTVVRAGYGLFYNRALLRTLDDYTLTSKTVAVDTNNDGGDRLLSQLKFPNVIESNDPRVKEFGVREAGFLRRLGANFRIPESYQASLGFERELRRNLKVEVNYVFNRGLHLWREINANAPRLPVGFSDFAAYLTSRDFDNRPDPATGERPLTATGNADFVRFNRSVQPTQNLREGDKTLVVFGLNNPSTSNQTSGIKAALEVLRAFRPDPGLTQIEELQARGNSAYHGVSVELTQRMSKRGFLRGNYAFSRLIDDGVVNTSSPLVAGDFRRERSRSLLDARHRVAVSGVYELPPQFWRVNLAGTFAVSSSRPFNISANGNDRNLDDVDNDRPLFSGDLRAINWRRPGASLSELLAGGFSLPTIGTVGNLPRNAGRGPAAYTLNLRLSRTFQLAEHRKLDFQIEAFNPLNSAVFSFGAEFVNFTPSGLGDFLTPPRTVKPRTMRVGLRFEF